jgi:enolase-phosphatase E1
MAVEFAGRGMLLDIEGTTSSVSFVFDVLFPFARRELANFLRDRWSTSHVDAACEHMAGDAGFSSAQAWWADQDDPQVRRRIVRDEALRLMDADAKATGLKQLQGLIWEAGFESGELCAHVFEDVAPALAAWKQAGLDVRVYSSGSVAAQKLFFGHTIRGDLLPFLGGHYDTTTGPKKIPQSYARIASDFKLDAGRILFLSDMVEELDAARAAGLRTILCLRSGNAPAPAGHQHDMVDTFADIALKGR